MPKIALNQIFDEEDILPERLPERIQRPVRIKRSHSAFVDTFLQHNSHETLGSEEEFTPTYTGSRHERKWIMGYLTPFYESGYISDVLFRVKGGKEANVYCCKAHPSTGLERIAAKIYRPRMFRNLRNDARYRQGRTYLDAYGKEVRDSGAMHAIAKGTRIGKEMQHASWLQHEVQTLELLSGLGADVPRPLACGENTILMEYLGDEQTAAPSLQEVRLPQKEARGLFERVMENIRIMLHAHRVHGDLSAYNVLYWEGQIAIIDFPQAVDPRGNREAYPIFERDVERICQYFESYGLRVNPTAQARRLWDAYRGAVELPHEREAEDILMRRQPED